MALDGIVIAGMVKELREKLVGGRIVKISQPERDELILTIKNYEQYKLLISAGAGLPLIYLTETTKPAPLTAPNFCMLLRKHLNSARILDVSQPGLERIITFKIEHLDELGDVRVKYLHIELMGKHSNIIFCDEEERVVDSIKRVSGLVSSQREVLPGREYFIVETVKKLSPLELTFEAFEAEVCSEPTTVSKAFVGKLTGISPVFASELAYRAGIDADTPIAALSEDVKRHLFNILSFAMEDVAEGRFIPQIITKDGVPFEFSSVDLTSMNCEGYEKEYPGSLSEMLERFYARKEAAGRIRQKSADLRKVLMNAIERTAKKLDIQTKQLEDTEKRDRFREYGELLTTYGYSIAPGEKSYTCTSFYSGDEVKIPLDETLSAIENAKRYFDKYSKLKRTYEATSRLIVETREELEQLESIRVALDIAVHEDDLAALKQELMDFGYVKKHVVLGSKNGKKTKNTSKPFHYVSSDGFDIYIGKNNYQNEELTFKFAKGNDMWFHAKGIPGSHVVVKTDGKELPDRTYEEAGRLAAFYSKGRDADKVEIDYLERRNVKKPNGSRPGFVVYYTNYSLMAKPDIEGLTQL